MVKHETDSGTGEPEQTRLGRRGNVGKRHEEAGGDLNRLWRTSRQTTQGRRCGGRANAQGETREGAGLCGDQQEEMYEEIRSSRDPRDHVEDG